VCCSAVQCGAVRCSVLQCVTVCYSVLQRGAVRCSVLQSATVLQCMTHWWCDGRSGVMQCVAACCSVLQSVTVLQCISECCRMLQCMSEWWCDDRSVIRVSIVWGGPKLMSLKLLVNSSVDVEKISFVPVRHGWVTKWSLYQRFLVKLPLLYQVVLGDKCEQTFWCWKKGHPIPGDDVSNEMVLETFVCVKPWHGLIQRQFYLHIWNTHFALLVHYCYWYHNCFFNFA